MVYCHMALLPIVSSLLHTDVLERTKLPGLCIFIPTSSDRSHLRGIH